MAKNTQLTNLAANTQADALAALLNSGLIKIYDGTQPATGDTAITTQTLLVTLTLNATAFAASVAGVLTANAITSGTAIAGSATTATWARVCKSDGTAVFDVTVGVGTFNIVLSSASITTGDSVAISAFTYTVAKSTSGS